MEENVCASLLSLVVDDDFTDIGMVVDGVAESHPNACPGSSSRSTAKLEATALLIILLGIMIV